MKVEFNVPVVCIEKVKVSYDIPDELIPRLKEFLSGDNDMTPEKINIFLESNNIEHLCERVDNAVDDNIDTESLYWEIDYENRITSDLDLTENYILNGLAFVRESGKVNMFDQKGAVHVLYVYDFDREARIISSLTNSQYSSYLKKLGKRVRAKKV